MNNAVTKKLQEMFPEEVAEFDRWWAEKANPKFKNGHCRRCGARVGKHKKKHRDWHYDLSLGFYMQGMMISKCAEGLRDLLLVEVPDDGG